MRIGALADECGIPTRTVRFYESRRLLPEPIREPNGYRSYDRDAVERVRFIRRAQGAGLTLAEIGGVLDIRGEGRPPCAHVTELLTSKLLDVELRIKELEILRTELQGLVERSRSLDPADCNAAEICQILELLPEASRP